MIESLTSLYKKTINGKPYWYLREMARVDGKPKMVNETYLGSAADIEKLHDEREAAAMPAQTRHLGFGDTAAVWGMLDRLDVIGVIDSVVGARRSDAGASVGTYLALAALNRVVAPTSKLGFAPWWKTTAADRFTRIKSGILDHRRFWDAMHKITVVQLAEIEQRLALAMINTFGFTFRDYKHLRFPRNEGMRINLILASSRFADLVTDASIHRNERKGDSPSDHVPVVVDLDIDGEDDDRPMIF